MSATSTAPNTTPDVDLILGTEFRVYDCLIATGFLLCFVIGFPLNCLALKHFINTNRRDLSTLLYIIGCTIDICSSLIPLPVAVNLMNKRRPGAFKSIIFCSMWYFLLLLLQQMSMFVVMLISLSRTIVIVCPFYKVKKKVVLLSVLVFGIYQCTWNTWWLLTADETYYDMPVGFSQAYSETITDALFQIHFNICSGASKIIVFLSFLASVAKLKMDIFTDASRTRNRYASITITYFAALFLVCNFFTFLNCVLYTATKVRHKTYPGPFYKSNFMFFYSWLLSEVMCHVLNASLNPILYIWRMKEMRLGIWNLIKSRRLTAENRLDHLTHTHDSLQVIPVVTDQQSI